MTPSRGQYPVGTWQIAGKLPSGIPSTSLQVAPETQSIRCHEALRQSRVHGLAGLTGLPARAVLLALARRTVQPAQRRQPLTRHETCANLHAVQLRPRPPWTGPQDCSPGRDQAQSAANTRPRRRLGSAARSQATEPARHITRSGLFGVAGGFVRPGRPVAPTRGYTVAAWSATFCETPGPVAL